MSPLKDIVDRLYHPSELGVIVVEECVSGYILAMARAEAESGPFRPAQKHFGKSVQDFDYFSLGSADEEAVIDPVFPALFTIKNAYECIYAEMMKEAGVIGSHCINSVWMNRYRKGSFGISPHRDEKRYINLIAVFVLAGKAQFGVCTKRDKSDSIEFCASPGSVILMRAPRNANEDLRPMHYVGQVTEERYALCLRQDRTAQGS